jgi:hypothetical protein
VDNMCKQGNSRVSTYIFYFVGSTVNSNDICNRVSTIYLCTPKTLRNEANTITDYSSICNSMDMKP